MSNFVSVDFETATGKRYSICQVGLVVVEQCKIVDRICYLVKPPDNLYSDWATGIHGIKPEDTENELTFDKVYTCIHPIIFGKNLVAHNAPFDIDCFNKTLLYYSIKPPFNKWFCTRKIYKMSLRDACAKNNIIYTPHNSLSDAEACAKLMIKDILQSKVF